MIKEKESIKEIVRLAGTVLITGAGIVSVISFFYSKEIIAWRYHEFIEAGSKSFGILILSFIPVSLTYIFGTLLTANGNLKVLNLMALTGVMINFILNYMLIPEFGSFGAAQATLVTQSLTALIQMIFAFRIFKLRFEPMFTVKLSLFLLTLVLGIRWFRGEFGELKHGLYLFPLFIIFGSLLGVFPLKKSLALLLSRKKG